MENFFVDDTFYDDIGSLMEDLDLFEEQDVENLDGATFSVDCVESTFEPLVTLSYDWIVDRVNEERFPEESDRIDEQFNKAINAIDFDKVNSMMPKLYYPTRKKFTLTKEDFLNYIKEPDDDKTNS